EMDSALGMNVDVGEGEVHQHRFATTDPAPQIHAGGLLVRWTDKASEEATVAHARRKPVERDHSASLRRIGLPLMGGHQGVVGDPYGSAHRADGPFGRFTRFSLPLKL